MRIFLKHIYILCVVCALVSCRTFVPIERSAVAQSDEALKAYLVSQNVEVTQNNSVHLLNGAYEKFDDMFAAIAEAKHHIHLEYFNFRNDSINEVLIDLLVKKAQEGVEVRALFDAFGNFSNNRPLKEEHVEAIRSRGVQLVKFDPIVFPWLNHNSLSFLYAFKTF